ncbi:hypothetical protein PG989_010464 [Apiospora arundinis]
MDINTKIDFIASSPLYEEEKPYFLHPSASADVDTQQIKNTNVVWDPKPMVVQSMRDREDLSLEKNGFCYIEHKSAHIVDTEPAQGAIAGYRKESEDMMRSLLNAEFVCCYDFKLRKNAPLSLDSYDPDDPALVEEAAIGAHDITVDTVPRLLKKLLTQEQLKVFMQPGYRFRLINTWRSLLAECEDRPLALCDYTSISPDDLLAADRIYPSWDQEIYFVKHNHQQRWFWLPKQRSSEPLLFMTYDSDSRSKARYCPHISVENPLAGSGAPPRESVETRNLVITKL